MKADTHGKVTARLEQLRKLAPRHGWQSLDQQLHCVLCEQIITGHSIRVIRTRGAGARLACSTPGCAATPSEWVHSGNPLVSDEAWRDWTRLLGSLCDDLRPRPVVRRFRPAAVVDGPSLAMAADMKTGGAMHGGIVRRGW